MNRTLPGWIRFFSTSGIVSRENEAQWVQVREKSSIIVTLAFPLPVERSDSVSLFVVCADAAGTSQPCQVGNAAAPTPAASISMERRDNIIRTSIDWIGWPLRARAKQAPHADRLLADLPGRPLLQRASPDRPAAARQPAALWVRGSAQSAAL